MFAPLGIMVIMLAPVLFERFLFRKPKQDTSVLYYHVYKLFDNPYVISQDQVCIQVYNPEEGKEHEFNINVEKDYQKFKRYLCNACKGATHIQFITYGDNHQRVVLSNSLNQALSEKQVKKPQIHYIDLKKWFYRINKHVTVTTLAETLSHLEIVYEHNRSSILKIYKDIHNRLKVLKVIQEYDSRFFN